MTRIHTDYDKNVFINCPFDEEYLPMFWAMTFVIQDAGFRPRCSLEETSTSDIRIEKIAKIISECKYSIHDISRTELDRACGLPRFNMPLELGIFLGCQKFGNNYHKQKECLVFDIELHRYHKFISDINGQDIKSHDGKPEKLVIEVRNWLRGLSNRTDIPGGKLIYKRYREFMKALPYICNSLNYDVKDLPFVDLSYIISYWLKDEANSLRVGILNTLSVLK